MAENPTITIDGVKYVPMTEEWYGELQAELERNRRARHIAVEEFRLWCQANKGTETVEDGLRACTPDELMAAVYREFSVSGWFCPTVNLITPLVEHLNKRAEREEKELRAAVQEPIVLEEV